MTIFITLLILVGLYIWIRAFKDNFLRSFSRPTDQIITISRIETIRDKEAAERNDIYFRYPSIEYTIEGDNEVYNYSKKNTLKIYELTLTGAVQESYPWENLSLPKTINVRRNILSGKIYISNRDLLN